MNLAARELRKHGIRVRLRGQSFEILAALLEHPSEIVTREQLHARLWPGNTFVDFDHGLNTAVKKLRAVLGDSPDNSRYIETIPRLGYRFIAPVTRQPGDSDAVNAAGRQVPLLPATPPALPVVRPAWTGRVAVALSSLLLLAAAGYSSWRHFLYRQPLPAKVMVAVLPFENLTGDPEQDYFSDGLTEEMITQLGRLDPERLGVIARTSVMHYKNSREQLKRIGQELGVQYVLEGSVRRDSNKVRITAQLIQMRDQTRVWGREFDRELSNLLALQGEIAQEIADETQLTFGDHKRLVPARQPVLSPKTYEAYDLYLKGRYFWNKRTAQSFQQAIKSFQEAIDKDPGYARAYAGLADSYTLLSGYSLAPQTEFILKARAAALRALEIDDSLAEAHTALALIVQNYDWDWQTAEKEFGRAIQLDPNYATAHHWYAEHLTWQGRFHEAFRESERARQLDPLSLIIAADKGAILYFSRQYDRAIEQCRAVLGMEPNFPRAHIVIYAYVEKGLIADALADLENSRRFFGDGPWGWSMLAYVYGRSGQQAQARHALQKLEQLNRRQQLDPAAFVWAYVGMGNKDQALVWLEKAYSQHSNSLTALKVEPAYDPLRGDPRFQDLLRRVGLTP